MSDRRLLASGVLLRGLPHVRLSGRPRPPMNTEGSPMPEPSDIAARLDALEAAARVAAGDAHFARQALKALRAEVRTLQADRDALAALVRGEFEAAAHAGDVLTVADIEAAPLHWLEPSYEARMAAAHRDGAEGLEV